MNIVDFLPHGAENAISMRDLASITGLDVRTVRGRVLDARRAGVPICSDSDPVNGGYFLPETPAEAAPCAAELRARIRSAQAALRPVEDYARGAAK